MRRPPPPPPPGVMPPLIRCCAPECGHYFDPVYQPGVDELPGYWLLTCANPRCRLHRHTFSHTNYPPANLDLYLEPWRKHLPKPKSAGIRSKLDVLTRRQLSILLLIATGQQVDARLTLKAIALRHGVHINTANRDLRRLRKLGLVAPRNGNYQNYRLT